MSEQVDQTFGGTWPYDPHRFGSSDGRMHFVDGGPRGGRPVVLVHGNPTWGMKEPAFRPELLERYWLRDFPKADVLRLEDASHYLQEDAHERIVPALVEFLGRS
ncbi:hypothetical protein [Dickeya zeae]|uniref:Alpha/beta hydrolase n=1 Tax=Dickeya zeae TaxID=204042 RepID=A0AAE7CYK4_9GAMM|nr:hypothetical protein [Dickeya zeae]QIZ50375.1 hypothetical protein DWG24_06060 [Dickeya zeae]QYM94038.1 hypothetical protein FGI21_20310 [Dickeya zeae]